MQQSQQKKLSTTHIILIVGFAILLTVILAFGYLLLSNKESTEAPIYGDATPIVGGTTYLVDESNIEEIEAQAAQEVADGMFLTTMNTEWSFATSQEPSYNAYIANDASNGKAVFVEVVLEGEDSPTFRSTVLPPGSALKEVTLAKTLEKGSYAAVCTYFLLNNDTNEIESTLALEVTIHVEG